MTILYWLVGIAVYVAIVALICGYVGFNRYED